VERDKSPKERILLVKGVAGLGNRMQCVATALAYARITSRRMIIDWRDPIYSDDGRNAFGMYFIRPDSGSLENLCDSSLSIVPATWSGHLDEPALEFMRRKEGASASDPAFWCSYTIDLRRMDYCEDVAVFWSPFDLIDDLRKNFAGELASWRCMNRQDILRSLFKQEFVPVASVTEQVKSFQADEFRTPVIGIHVRFTDKRSHLGAIKKRLVKLLRSHPGATIFLATDSLEIQKKFQGEFANVKVIPKWFSPAGRTIHRSPLAASRTENGKAALVEMYLLSKCDYLIIDEHSSFGMAAAWLSNIPWSRIYNVRLVRMLPLRIKRFAWYYRERIRSRILWRITKSDPCDGLERPR
jgi:hypothetical protein